MGNSSIGIIGGADGPTKIFLSGNPLLEIITALAVVIIIAAVAVIIKKRK